MVSGAIWNLWFHEKILWGYNVSRASQEGSPGLSQGSALLLGGEGVCQVLGPSMVFK